MHIQLGWGDHKGTMPPSVVCIGTFDGVHLGHQRVIEHTIQEAKKLGLAPSLITFDRNPLELLRPVMAPIPIATWKDNLEIAEKLGIAIAWVLPFDHAMSQMTCQEFLDQIIIEAANAREVVVGHDFAMGKNRQGTIPWLSERIKTHVVGAFELDGHRVSSSAIRQAVSSGEICVANKLLGRSFSLSGVVVGGEKLGRTLGYPTANIALTSPTIIPADGVYAAMAQLGNESFVAAVSIGTKPTFGTYDKVIEAYLLDYPGSEIYGSWLKLEFIDRIRAQVKYETQEKLVLQISQDVEEVRDRLHLACEKPSGVQK